MSFFRRSLSSKEKKRRGDDNLASSRLPDAKNIDLENSYDRSKLKHDHYDVIYIGSGMSALAGASIVAQHGKKVLLLDRAEQLGGLLHTFKEEGYEFCAGLHYLFDDPEFMMTLYDRISDGGIHLVPLLDDKQKFSRVWKMYDPSDPSRIVREVHGLYNADFSESVEALIAEFAVDRPDLEAQIRQFYSDVEACFADVTYLMILRHAIPRCLWGCAKWILEKIVGVRMFELSQLTYGEYLQQTFPGDDRSSRQLRSLHADAVALFGYMNATTANSVLTAYALLASVRVLYPDGGSSSVVRSVLRTIYRNAGEAFCDAEVTDILLDEDDHAIGVRLRNGDVIHSKWVVSTCGIKTTFGNLLPARVSPCEGWEEMYAKASAHTMLAGLGFDVPIEELGDSEQIRTLSEIILLPEDTFQRMNRLGEINDREEEEEEGGNRAEVAFVSLMSANHVHPSNGETGNAGITVMAPTCRKFFERWEGTKVKQRGAEYEDYKESTFGPVFELIFQHYPSLKEHLVVETLASPLSFSWWTGWQTGECTGAFIGPTRNLEMFDKCIRIPGKVKGGLVVSGQDAMPWGGIPFAALAGVISAMEVLDNPWLLYSLLFFG